MKFPNFLLRADVNSLARWNSHRLASELADPPLQSSHHGDDRLFARQLGHADPWRPIPLIEHLKMIFAGRKIDGACFLQSPWNVSARF
jgi:hypothetical protein